MDIHRIKAAIDIYRRYESNTLVHSILDHLIITYGQMYFDRIKLSDFDCTDGDYLELQYIKPEEVVFYQPNFSNPYLREFEERNWQPTLHGPWDRIRCKFYNTIFFKSLRNHFENGVPWEETIFVNRRMHAGEGTPRTWGVNQPSDVQSRCNEVEELYQSITENGFYHRTKREEFAEDVLVNIARDGSYILVSGRHRIAIARILNLNEIPVRTLIHHVDWV